MSSPAKARTIRFAQVVKQSGAPQVHTLWVAPEKDAGLRKAEKTQRVMTLTEPAHGRAWVGEVGFSTDRKTAHQYLIFPKTLRAFAGAKVVGINLDSIVEAKLVSPKSPRMSPAKSKPKPRSKSAPPPPPPPLPPKPKPVARPVAPPVHAKARAPRHAKPPKRLPRETPDLVHAVRAAMHELKKGNAAAAYQKLEQTLPPAAAD